MKQNPGEFFKKYLQRNTLIAEEIFALYLRIIQANLSWYPRTESQNHSCQARSALQHRSQSSEAR